MYNKIDELLDKWQEGTLEAYMILKDLKDFKTDLEDQIIDIESEAMRELKDYENKFQLKGFEFEKRNGSTRYDYKHIKEWVDQKNKLKEIEQKYKAAYSQYQKGVSGVTVDGEVLEIPKTTQSKKVLIIRKIFKCQE